MKRRTKALIAAVALGAAALWNAPLSQSGVPLGTPQQVTFTWDYPAGELNTNLVFLLYHRTNLMAGASWQLLATVSGTNLCHSVPLLPGEHYFYVTASNFWGESDPSNVASTPALPRSGALTIRRGN